jgi:hypothetical protein
LHGTDENRDRDEKHDKRDRNDPDDGNEIGHLSRLPRFTLNVIPLDFGLA